VLPRVGDVINLVVHKRRLSDGQPAC
jgi:hypothetical protein